MESGRTTCLEEGDNSPDMPLGDEFEERSLSDQAKMALREGGPHVCQGIRCWVIDVKNVKELIGIRHERLGFVIQETTIN